MTARRLPTFATLALGAALALTACADAAPVANGDPSPLPPVDRDDVVLRLSYEGGLVPAGFPLLDVPAFTLYGDGTIITPGAQIAIYPGPALPAISQRTVDETGIRALIERAREAGLGETDLDLSDMGSVGIADASTAVFTLTVGGQTTTAKVYALGLDDDATAMPGLSERDAEIRADLAALVTDLTDLGWTETAGGSLSGEEPYVGEAARLLVSPYLEDPELRQEPVEWPLDRPLRTVGDPAAWDPQTRCAVVVGDDWAVLRDAADAANQLTPWVDGRTERTIAFRPLLPGEDDC